MRGAHPPTRVGGSERSGRGKANDRFRGDILAGRLVDGMNFHQRVWALTARIPRGQVTTYGRIAAALGSRGSRAVGQALNRNPYAPQVPCHRVVGSDGSLTGFASGLAKKQQILTREKVPLTPAGKVDLTRAGFDF